MEVESEDLAVESIVGIDQDLVGLELLDARVHEAQEVGAATEYGDISDGAGSRDGAGVAQDAGAAGRQAAANEFRSVRPSLSTSNSWPTYRQFQWFGLHLAGSPTALRGSGSRWSTAWDP